ncbi:non-structural maintenance of chromosomes element 1 homolog [Amphiura filiformis]|uniref:non-structural maintenance of chromosomes element 1 homolog n=1 Tax=Amphiura filiformis TaxID=82378 RepID=UPI003B2263E1
MANMTDVHRLIVQTFMSRGILTEKELGDVTKHACDYFKEKETSGERFIRDINPNIQSVSMEIRTGKEEVSGANVYVLVRTTESELGRLSTDYTPNELELFKKMMGLIIESEGAASSTDILNLTNNLQKRMSKAEAETVLKSLVRNKWLTEVQGEVSLSNRSIIEMEHYMQSVYQDEVKSCNICKKIVLRGCSCYQRDCGIRIHFYCARRFFQNQTHVTCPNCKKPWTDEFASTDEDEDDQPTQSRQTASTSRKRKDRRV